MLVLACLLPVFIGTTALLTYAYRESRAQLEETTIMTVRALVQAVDSHLLRVQAVAEALATSDSLIRGDFITFHQLAREAVARVGLGSNVVVRDEAGRPLIDTAVDYGTPLTAPAAPEQVRAVFATGKPVIANFTLDPVLKRPVISVEVPVLIDGEVVYALGVGILPAHFNAILKAQKLPPDWIAGVFDRTSTIVGRTHAPEKFVGKKASPRLLKLMLDVQEGFGEATTVDGFSVMSFYSRSPVTNWSVAIGIPQQVIEGMLMDTLALLAVGVAALFGIALLLAWMTGGRIAHSIRALTAPAAALGRGEAVTIPPVQVHEASEVASAIGRAAGLLQERDAALHAREAELIETNRLARFGTWSWDLQTGEVRTSESIPEIFGREIPPFPQQRGTVLTIESWERMNAAAQEALHFGKGYDMELQVNHGKGGIIWIHVKCEAVRDSTGAVRYLRGTVQDITERKRADELRRESEEELRQFKFFSDHANDSHLLLDQSGRIRYANKIASARLGYAEEELLQLRITDVDPAYEMAQFGELFLRSKQARIPPFERTHRRKDGSTFPVEIAVTVLELRGEWLMFVTSRDISERKQNEQRVRDASLHDWLTGLPNRALVFEYGSHLLAAARRGHGGGAMLFIDLDRFKPINDLYGHETGDRVLQEVGRRLRQCTRTEDMVGRLGGDEFVILLPHLDASRHREAIVAQHVVDSISRPFQVNAFELSISPSIGIAYFPEHADDVDTLIHAADLAMYQAKQAGRANFQFYTPELERRADESVSSEARLRHALKHDGLRLHYQPVIDIRSGRLIGAEALLRLTDNGEGGEIPGPAIFIPVAESTGLIAELGEWVAIAACCQYRTWLAQGLKIRIAINVSPLQFRQRTFAEKLSGIIADTRMDPDDLEIELTESAIMESVDDAVAVLNRIKSLGVKVALDDFGTGYSSLSSLSNLPLDKLKVDQSFVRRIGRDKASRAVTEAIITLGRTLKLDVVGEGIESEETLRYLDEHGCNLAQGYWFSAPLPAQEFAAWSRERWSGNRVIPLGQA